MSKINALSRIARYARHVATTIKLEVRKRTGMNRVPADVEERPSSVSVTTATRTIAARDASAEPFLPNWNQVSKKLFPLIEPEGVSNPVLTAKDVTDFPALYVADPFLYCENGIWYMFFEVSPRDGNGVIGLATSRDGFKWKYEKIILSQSWHLSYPLVFKSFNTYYLVPEAHQTNAVQVYESTAFPYQWRIASTIVSGRPFADPTIFFHNDTFWMFVGDIYDRSCYLYYSDALLGGWREHPKSPLFSWSKSKARPAGRAFVYDNGRVIRLAQKSDILYGEQVRAFEVHTLSRTDYEERELWESPILKPTGSGWNSTGMHQFSPWWTGDSWICAVDGHRNHNYSIGIYLGNCSVRARRPSCRK